MILKKNKLIFTDYVIKKNLKFNYIDIGARGNIVSPWIELEDISLIVGFEPDLNEAKRLNDAFQNRRYYDIALWSEPATKKVYINEWESTSSMYLPNIDFINNFQSKHWKGRVAKLEVDVECNTLDNILLKDKVIPDFIKIDTQGSELEILKGSENILKEYSPIVTCETWCAEVYKDAPMMHKIIEYMDGLGYQVYDMEIAAAWRHGKKEVSSKRKSIGYEVLFVKTKNLNNKNKNSMIKFLLLLELYGYRDYALYVMSLFNNEFESLNLLMNENNIKDQKMYKRILNMCINQVNKIFNFKFKLYPTIKY